MANSEPLVDEVAAAILDGSPIDWQLVDTTSTGADRALIDELRLLSALADLHRLHPAHPVLDEARPDAWGHLRLLERVGGGSFGDVYRAHDTRLEREVAVKLMPARESGDAGIAAIIREGRLLARVRHPGIVTIYDAQQIGDRVGLWMEFVRGRTLEERLQEQGSCTAADAIEMGIELCRAVEAVHAAGLLHRDIKTQNVMRADDGRLLLMDFGVGREVTEATMSHVAGTPLYLAPEILRGQPASVSTDVYAIGVLLFRVLTGSFPVRATLISELKRAHEAGERQSLLEARPDVPVNLAAVIDRAVHPAPELRYDSAGALADALEAVRPRVRSRRWMIAAAAGLVLIAAGGLAVNQGWIAVGSGAGGSAIPAQQWVLITEFNGTTGDADLDTALRQAVISELEASSHVNVFPAAWAREALGRMGIRPRARIDEKLGLQLARTERLAVLVTGSVETSGGAYRISLRAREVSKDRVLTIPAERHVTRQAALAAAFVMGRRLREMLGESPTSIRSTSAPLIPVTPQSYDTQRQFALGQALLEEERGEEALPHFQEAISRDPEFAMAHLYAGHAYAYINRFDLRDVEFEYAARLAQRAEVPMSAVEREKILADYHTVMERFHEAAAHLRTVLSLRPGDARMRANLGVIYGSMRQYGPAIDEFEAAARSYPHFRLRWMLADMYSASGRPDDAITLIAAHLEKPMDWIAYAKHLAIAGRRQEAGEALEEAELRASQSAYESWSDLALAKADFLRSGGQYAAAESALRLGIERAGAGTPERLELAMASLLLDAGRRREAISRLRRIQVQLARNRIVFGVLAARAGDLDLADEILQKLLVEASERRAPRAEARVSQMLAEIKLARGEADGAHGDAVRAANTFTTTWTLETLARAKEALGNTKDAIATRLLILDRPGERATDWDAPAYAQLVLTRHRLAQLLDKAGEFELARQAYDGFLRLWDRADANLTAYVDARARRARLEPRPRF